MAFRKGRAHVCPGCRAPLKVAPGAQLVTCEYCGQSVDFSGPSQAPQAPAASARPVNTRLLFSGMAGALCVTLLALALVRQLKPGHQGPGMIAAAASLASERLQWDSYIPVLAVDINQDGTEDIIGRYRILQDNDAALHVGAFDGKTFERLWAAGPFGLWGQGAYQHTFLVVEGDRLLVTEVRGSAHVLSLTEGKSLARISLSDKPTWACSVLGEPGTVWVQVKDGQHVLVDTAAGSSRAASAREPPCKTTDQLSRTECSTQSWHAFVPHGGCAGPRSAPKTAGFEAERVLTDGALSVAVGHRSPGTRVPMVVGFRSDGEAGVSWQRVLPEQDPITAQEGTPELVDLVDGRFYAVYGLVDRSWRMVVIDASNGKTLWDVAIPRSKDGSKPDVFTLTPQRVYVPHWTWLDVFDARTGSHLGTLGQW